MGDLMVASCVEDVCRVRLGGIKPEAFGIASKLALNKKINTIWDSPGRITPRKLLASPILEIIRKDGL